VPDFARVKKWPSCEENNIVFVWYHAENEEPTWLPTAIPQIQNGDVWYRGRNEFLVNSHIQVRTSGDKLTEKLEPSCILKGVGLSGILVVRAGTGQIFFLCEVSGGAVG
jgi:hypothetical protein